MGEGVSVTGGNNRRVQVRKERKDGFSEAKRQVFLDTLAGCATLYRAAAAAGVSREGAMARRHHVEDLDQSLRQIW